MSNCLNHNKIETENPLNKSHEMSEKFFHKSQEKIKVINLFCGEINKT